MSKEEGKKKNYIRYTPEQLAAVPSPAQQDQATAGQTLGSTATDVVTGAIVGGIIGRVTGLGQGTGAAIGATGGLLKNAKEPKK